MWISTRCYEPEEGTWHRAGDGFNIASPAGRLPYTRETLPVGRS